MQFTEQEGFNKKSQCKHTTQIFSFLKLQNYPDIRYVFEYHLYYTHSYIILFCRALMFDFYFFTVISKMLLLIKTYCPQRLGELEIGWNKQKYTEYFKLLILFGFLFVLPFVFYDLGPDLVWLFSDGQCYQCWSVTVIYGQWGLVTVSDGQWQSVTKEPQRQLF